MSFEGLFEQALAQQEDAKSILERQYTIAERVVEELQGNSFYDTYEGEKQMEIYRDVERYTEEHNLVLTACAEIAYDVILALAKGDSTIEELRDFMFSGMTKEQITALPYKGRITIISK